MPPRKKQATKSSTRSNVAQSREASRRSISQSDNDSDLERDNKKMENSKQITQPQNVKRMAKKDIPQQNQQQIKSAAQIQEEVNIRMFEVMSEILSDPNQSVRAAHAKTFSDMMLRQFRAFKVSFAEIIDKIVVYDEKDSQIKGLYRLLEKFYNEIAFNPKIPQADLNTLIPVTIQQLLDIYSTPKISLQAQVRSSFLLYQLVQAFEIGKSEKVKLNSELRFSLAETVIEILNSSRSTIQIYGIQLAGLLCSQTKPKDQLYTHLMRLMTQSRSKETRKAAISNIKAPFTQSTLIFLSKRLRDKDEEVRRIAFQKLHRCGIKIEDFPSLEQRMLIMKEGLTDPSEAVRFECIEFLKPLLYKPRAGQEERAPILREDLSYVFKVIDCKMIFVKEYYIQLPFILLRFIFHCLGADQEVRLAKFITKIIQKLKLLAGVEEESKISYEDYENNDEEEDDKRVKKRRLTRDDRRLTINNKQSNIKMKEPDEDEETSFADLELGFEDLLFLRISYEFSKMYRRDRSEEYLEVLDQLLVSFESYSQIFNYLLYNPPLMPQPLLNPSISLNGSFSQQNSQIQGEDQLHQQYQQKVKPDRLMFSEWMKFSLQLSIEEETTRRNIVSLIFGYISQIGHSYDDYKHLLHQEKFLLKDFIGEPNNQTNEEDNLMSDLIGRVVKQQSNPYDSDLEEEEFEALGIRPLGADDSEIQIEIRNFQDLGMKRDIQDYCKPFSFESLVIDSDDICRIAVIVARKLLDQRADEFSISMLQAISDIKEPVEASHDSTIHNYKKLKDDVMAKLEKKLERLNEIYGEMDEQEYSVEELNRVMRKLHYYVALIEEITLKEKLSFKRALNLCLILLKQCRADVNDQNMVQIIDALIGPTIKAKDQDNMLLAVECIGLLCLLDKEVFSNYARIFIHILQEDVLVDNLREKIIALKSSVDSLIIHGAEAKTIKLQKIIVEDYMVIKDKVLRQITIEGICKMLFSRKLTQLQDGAEMEFLLTQLMIQWFDRTFNWQNSLVRQILNTFFKSFVLFSQQRCLHTANALAKLIFSILGTKYGNLLSIKKKKEEQAQGDNDENGVRRNKKLASAAIANISNKQDGLRRSSRGAVIASKKSYKERDVDDYYEEDGQQQSDEEDYDVDSNDMDESFYKDNNQAKLQKIVSELDPVQITKVFMLLLSRDYVNQNAAKQFQLDMDLNVEFLIQICYLNATRFKKVTIVKEYLVNIVEYINVYKCESIPQLKQLIEYLEPNMKMLVQGNQRLKKIKEATESRMQVLIAQRQEQELDGVQSLLVEDSDKNYLARNHEEFEEWANELQVFYETEIQDILIDLVQDDDEEYKELNDIQKAGLDRSMISPYAVKNQSRTKDLNSSALSQSQSGYSRRKSGLRTNNHHKSKKPDAYRQQRTRSAIQTTDKLRPIPEDYEDSKEVSSSEKPVMKQKLYETIVEDIDDEDEFDSDDEISTRHKFTQGNNLNSQQMSQNVPLFGNSSSLNKHNLKSNSNALGDIDMDEEGRASKKAQQEREKDQRRSVMSKLSKQMAKDFAVSKKRTSVLSQSGSQYSQGYEQRIREDVEAGRTVFKISKGKSSMSPLNQSLSNQDVNSEINRMGTGKENNIDDSEGSSDDFLNVSHNLSRQFEIVSHSENREPHNISNLSYSGQGAKNHVSFEQPVRQIKEFDSGQNNIRQSKRCQSNHKQIGKEESYQKIRQSEIKSNENSRVDRKKNNGRSNFSNKQSEIDEDDDDDHHHHLEDKNERSLVSNKSFNPYAQQRMTRNRMKSISATPSLSESMSSNAKGVSRRGARAKRNEKSSSIYYSSSNSDISGSEDEDVFDFMKSGFKQGNTLNKTQPLAKATAKNTNLNSSALNVKQILSYTFQNNPAPLRSSRLNKTFNNNSKIVNQGTKSNVQTARGVHNRVESKQSNNFDFSRGVATRRAKQSSVRGANNHLEEEDDDSSGSDMLNLEKTKRVASNKENSMVRSNQPGNQKRSTRLTKRRN